MVETVLVYIENNHSYLMLHRTKKKDDLNGGFWIGVGGHIEEGETPDEALVREVKEETGLTLLGYKKRGCVYFSNGDEEEMIHLYTSSFFKGDLIECDEGELNWIDIDRLSSLNMWDGDKYFFELLLNEPNYFELKLVYEGRELKEAIRLK